MIISNFQSLYKPENFNVKNNLDNFLFWGCLHLCHDKKFIWERRGYKNVKEHFYGLINNWNNKANNNTIGFLLGDNVFGDEASKNLEHFFQQINFNSIYMMGGNHYAGISEIFSKLESNIWEITQEKRVILIPNYFEILVNKIKIVLSHYPQVSWNGQGKGSIMLHSHCHGNLYKSEIGKILYKGKIIDIGVENAPYPYSLKEVIKIFQDVPPLSFDHHNAEIQTPF